MPAKGKCVVCGVGPREIPDRENPGRLQLKVCRKCHQKRLAGDLRRIVALQGQTELKP
jgi:cytochrome c553